MSRYDDDSDDAEVTPAAAEEELDATPEAPKEPREAVDPEVEARKGRVIRRGWGAAEQTRSADSPFAQRLKLGTDAILVKFLQDEPYASYRQHWLEKEGQKSYTCLDGIDAKGCPLCDAGHRPSARFSFNVVLLDSGSEPLIRSYDVGPRVIDTLKGFHQDPRMGPLSKHYWAIKRTGTKSTSQTSHNMVRERDLVDEWDVDPLTPEALADLLKKAYDESIISLTPRKVMLTVAAEELES